MALSYYKAIFLFYSMAQAAQDYAAAVNSSLINQGDNLARNLQETSEETTS